MLVSLPVFTTHSVSFLNLLPSHDLSPLRHHMREEDIRACRWVSTARGSDFTVLTRDVDQEDHLQSPCILLS